MFCRNLSRKILILLLFHTTHIFSYPYDLTFQPAYVSYGFQFEYCKLSEKELDLTKFRKVGANPHNRPIQIPSLQW